jgi:hypothetical protein
MKMNISNQVHQFTLVLKNVNESTPMLEDSLFEAGCDDVLINFRNNTVFLDFERGGESFEKVIIDAIKQVESASVKPVVVNVAPEDLVTMSEAAKRLNKTRQALHLWINEARRKSKERPFPQPLMKLADKSPLWKWKEIAEWLYVHNLIQEKQIVENAIFIENINAALEERDKKTRISRKSILEKLAAS